MTVSHPQKHAVKHGQGDLKSTREHIIPEPFRPAQIKVPLYPRTIPCTTSAPAALKTLGEGMGERFSLKGQFHGEGPYLPLDAEPRDPAIYFEMIFTAVFLFTSS